MTFYELKLETLTTEIGLLKMILLLYGNNFALQEFYPKIKREKSKRILSVLKKKRVNLFYHII